MHGNGDRGGPGRWLSYLFEAAVIIAASGYLPRSLVGTARHCSNDSRSCHWLAYLEKPARQQMVKEDAL